MSGWRLPAALVPKAGSSGWTWTCLLTKRTQGGLVDVLEHPNQERYRGQKIYVVVNDQLNTEEREILDPRKVRTG